MFKGQNLWQYPFLLIILKKLAFTEWVYMRHLHVFIHLGLSKPLQGRYYLILKNSKLKSEINGCYQVTWMVNAEPVGLCAG